MGDITPYLYVERNNSIERENVMITRGCITVNLKSLNTVPNISRGGFL